MYKNIDTNEVYTLDELKESFEQFKHEMSFDTFEDYMDHFLRMGREGTGGFVEFEEV